MKPLDAEEIQKLLTSITTGAEGLDGVSVHMLKMIGDAVIPALEDIVNLSINSSAFPRLWTQALMKPIPKVANPTTPLTYVP